MTETAKQEQKRWENEWQTYSKGLKADLMRQWRPYFISKSRPRPLPLTLTGKEIFFLNKLLTFLDWPVGE